MQTPTSLPIITRIFKIALAATTASFIASISLNAQVLMIDFGPTAAAGSSLSNSPYHTDYEAINKTQFSGTVWNTVQTSDITNGSLKWADNTLAAELSLDIGYGTSTILNLGNYQPNTSGILGNKIKTGVYIGSVAGTSDSVGTDAIYHGTSNNANSVGFRLSGLEAGKYDIYITGRNTNVEAHEQKFYLSSGQPAVGATSFNFSNYSHESLTYSTGTSFATSSWINGENYVKFSVTLTAGDVLDLAVLGGTGDKRGFLNSVQIVAVPEPATIALIAGLGVLAAVVIRRRD